VTRWIGVVSTILILMTGSAYCEWKVIREDDFVRDDGVEGSLLFIKAIDLETAVAAGENGLILRTTDGGKTWSVKSIKEENLGITFWGGFFLNDKIGWVVGIGSRGFFGGSALIYKTVDGGLNWSGKQTRRGRLLDAFFTDEKNGWIVGETRMLLRTTDGGENWDILSAERARAGEMRYNYNAIWFNTPKSGWIVGAYGIIMHTKDGGENWEQVSIEEVISNLNDVFFLNEKEGWIVGQDGVILHTADGGKSWKVRDDVTDYTLRAVHFVTPLIGWIVGDSGLILETTDGGENWREIKPLTNSVLIDVSGYRDPKTKKIVCYAVGEWGIVLKSK
jgi:photosystem II stability/assembly factor-like uncharacterized protein